MVCDIQRTLSYSLIASAEVAKAEVRACEGNQVGRMSVPRAVAFDLDGCLWDPEMYELWGSGGSPFEKDGDNLVDRGGVSVHLIGDARAVLNELSTAEKFQSTHVATASSCDEPSWARECIQKFEIDSDKSMGSAFHSHEIYKASSKQIHISKICEAAGCKPEEVIFFDNQMNNCNAVVKMGTTTVFTGTSGVTSAMWKMALEEFPAPGRILRM
jgi:magnesium-dependent phosphatase 1